jgi:hypothetical protein
MRRYWLLPSVVLAAVACLSGSAVAGPIGSDGQALAVVTPFESEAPPAAKPGERTRLVSYLILRGLQGAGPFLGSR